MTVHNLIQATIVLEWGESQDVKVDLMSPSGGCRTHGAGYYHFLGQRLGTALLIDCGDHAGDVLACIQLRAPRIIADCRADVQARLVSMCARAGLSIGKEIPDPVLLLRCDDDSCEIVRKLGYEARNLKS